MMNHSHRRPVPFWVIPLTYMVVALVAGLTIPRNETKLIGNVSPMSTSAAIAIYSAVASGTMALTGVVFSLAFVMIQFSASAYSPRLVAWMYRDPITAHALGVFSATFLYAVTAVSGVDREGSGKVPFLSVALVFLLLTASAGFFVALIQRVGLLQINQILAFTGTRGRKAIETLYPRESMTPVSDALRPAQATSPPTQTLIHRGRPQAIQAMHVAELVSLAQSAGARIESEVAVGDTVVEGIPLLQVFGSRQLLDETKLRNAIDMGDERTFEQDPKYAIRLLVDIAIRALSPAVNDPSTAVQALDQIEDLILRLGLRSLDIGDYRDNEGHLRLVIPFPSWDDFLLLAFDEIRAYGASSVQVMRRMKSLVSDLIAALPEERRESLRYWEERIRNTVARSFEDAQEKANASREDRQGLGVPRRQKSA